MEDQRLGSHQQIADSWGPVEGGVFRGDEIHTGHRDSLVRGLGGKSG